MIDLGQPRRASEAPPRSAWRVITDQKAFIAVFCLAAVITALILSYVTSEKYQANTTIFYRPREVTRLKATEAQAFGSPAPAAPFKVISQTLEQLLQDNAILRPVVLDLHLDQKPPLTGSTLARLYRQFKDEIIEALQNCWSVLKYGRVIERDKVDAAVDDLAANIRVRNKDSYVFLISARNKDPERAAAIVDRIAQELLAWLREQDRNPGRRSADQLAHLLVEKEQEAASLRNAVEDIVKSNQIVSLSVQTEQDAGRLSRLLLDRANIGSDIAHAKSKLDAITAKLGRGLANLQPEDYKHLTSERIASEVDLSGLEAKHAAVQRSIDELNERLAGYPTIQNRLNALQVELQVTERNIIALGDARQEAAVQMTSEASEVKVLAPATVPDRPVAPIKVYHVGLAALFALLASVGLVMVIDYLREEMAFTPAKISADRVADDEHPTELQKGRGQIG
jgi:uncharacterized protein involved in exopolysaccharide biosynthesis